MTRNWSNQNPNRALRTKQKIIIQDYFKLYVQSHLFFFLVHSCFWTKSDFNVSGTSNKYAMTRNWSKRTQLPPSEPNRKLNYKKYKNKENIWAVLSKLWPLSNQNRTIYNDTELEQSEPNSRPQNQKWEITNSQLQKEHMGSSFPNCGHSATQTELKIS